MNFNHCCVLITPNIPIISSLMVETLLCVSSIPWHALIDAEIFQQL